MDLSPTIAWVVPFLGVLAAAVLGAHAGNSPRASYWGNALVYAIVIAVVLTPIQVFVHGACIEPLKLCTSRGDGNMSYWFQSAVAAPLYWLVGGSVWRLKQ